MAAANGLTVDEISACNLGAEKLRAHASLIETPDLNFLADFLKSLGWNGEKPFARPAATDAAPAAVEGHGTAAPLDAEDLDAEKPAAGTGSGVMALDESDEEMSKRPKENLFGADLDAELRKENNIAIDHDDNDFDRLPRESEAFPILPASAETDSMSGAMKKVIGKTKQEALLALEQGSLQKALEKYTKALTVGGASAQLLATRGALLVKLRRPLAAIRDCSVALKINGSLSMALRIRGTCHRKLGHWRRSHRDLSQAQKLDFDASTSTTHNFVAKKLGLVQDAKTGQWTKQQDYSRKASVFSPAARAKAKQTAQEQNIPSAASGMGGVEGMVKRARVQVQGIQAKPEMNGMIGILEDFDPASGRYQVRLRGNSESHKFKLANLKLLGPMSMAEQLAEQQRRVEEQRIARRRAVEKRLKQDGIPDMDPSELVEAEMSGMALDEALCKMVRKLEPDQALEILWQVQATRTANLPALLREKVKEIWGDEDDDDNSEEEEVDPERLQEETVPLPPLPDDLEAEPEDEQAVAMIKKEKEAAVESLEVGNIPGALAHYTEAIELGGGSALLLSKRAELLLGQKRPCAAIRDCTAALEVNPDCGKAFRIRGMAHRRLGHWPEAHSDLAQGQTLDFDDSTIAIQSFVAKKAKALEDRETARRRKTAKRARLA